LVVEKLWKIQLQTRLRPVKQYERGRKEKKPIIMVPRAKNGAIVLLYLVAGTVMAQEVKVTPLVSKVMTDVSGKEGLMITVEYPPGRSHPIHRQRDEAGQAPRGVRGGHDGDGTDAHSGTEVLEHEVFPAAH
jgi:hypothetical protein